MSFINFTSKEVNYKILYCGPSTSGKTSNLQQIYRLTTPQQHGSLRQINQRSESTLFYDFLPLSVGDLRGYQSRFHLYTVAGHRFFPAFSEIIFKGVDGIIFVFDSAPEQMVSNLHAFEGMRQGLENQGYDWELLPFVFQYNKRDLSTAVPVHELETTFNSMHKSFVEAIATRGIGVLESLNEVGQQIIRKMKLDDTDINKNFNMINISGELSESTVNI